MKKFTLIELLVIIAIIGIVISLIVGACSSGDYYSIKTTGTYRCVNTYTSTSGGGEDSSATTSKRVNVVKVDDYGKDVGINLTFTVDDDWWGGVSNSATLYAQFEEGKYYTISTVGYRYESQYWPKFPNVTSVNKIDRPLAQAELGE